MKKDQKANLENAKEAGIRFYNSSEEQELAYLREGLKRTDQERFAYLMKLMKMQRVMQTATFSTNKI